MNLQLTTKTMSSKEIAELTGKLHKHVMRDIREIEKELGETISGLSSYTTPQNKAVEMLLLNKENTILLVSGYSIQLRQKIIKRWQELENATKLPSSFSEALLLAYEQAKQLEIQAPKVAAFDALIGADTIFNMAQTAKLLGWGRNRLFAELRNRKILMADNTPFQQHVDNGRFVIKDTPVQRTIGTIIVSQTYVTTKGQVWLFELLKESN